MWHYQGEEKREKRGMEGNLKKMGKRMGRGGMIPDFG